MRQFLRVASLLPLLSASFAFASSAPVREADGDIGWVVPLAGLAVVAGVFIVMVEVLSRRGLSSAPRNPPRFRVMPMPHVPAHSPSGSVGRPAAPLHAPAPVRKSVVDAPLRPSPKVELLPQAKVQSNSQTARVRIVDTGFWLDGSLARPGERLAFRWTDADGVHSDAVDFTPNAKTGGHFIYTGRRASRVEILSRASQSSDLKPGARS